jgi:hypothetical protein
VTRGNGPLLMSSLGRSKRYLIWTAAVAQLAPRRMFAGRPQRFADRSDPVLTVVPLVGSAGIIDRALSNRIRDGSARLARIVAPQHTATYGTFVRRIRLDLDQVLTFSRKTRDIHMVCG